MGGNFLDLYHERILQLDKDPYHFEKLNVEPYLVATNPLCGDRFRIFQRTVANNTDFSFYGHGCAVSKASTSLLVKALEDIEIDKVLDISRRFIDYIENDAIDCPIVELKIFAKVKLYPARMDCATLVWKALLKKFKDDLR